MVLSLWGGVVKQEKSPEEIRLDKINQARFKLTEVVANFNDLAEGGETEREGVRNKIKQQLEEIKRLI